MSQWEAFQEWREGRVLRAAASTGDSEALRRGLERGPDIDEYDNSGLTLLHDLCRGDGSGPAGSDRLACFHLLLEAGADPTKRSTRGGWFPLLFAAEQAHTELCAALLASGAQSDLNRANNVGVMPLHCACRSGCTSNIIECVALLLSRGASVNARTRPGGATPLYIATSHRRRRLYPYCYVPVPSFQHQGLQSTGSSTTPSCILWTGARPITFTYGKSPRQGDIGTTRATTSTRLATYSPPNSRAGASHRRWFGA